ncbi:MAG: vWA domain-containing protein [Candidatus Asgardarchaeia archaeon]
MGFADGNGGQKDEDMQIVESEGNCGCRGDHSQWYKGQGNPKNKKAQRKWERAVKQAAEAHAKKQGNLPGELQRLVEEAMPIVDWREVLVNYVVKSHDDFSYRQPDRRFLDSEFIMPSMEEGEKIDEVVIAVDTSGSIDHSLLNKFAGEAKGILSAFKNIKAYFCSWDTQVYDWKEVNDYQVNLQYFGGGGTSTVCVFDEIEKRNITPSCVIFFTDLYADFPDKEPDYDVLWITPKRDHGESPGWGRVILYRD